MFRKNVQGDVTHIYKLNGGSLTLAAKYVYDAWGKCTVENRGIETIGDINPIRYRGYYYDIETGLYYLNARYYDPETGRFISADDTAFLEPNTVNGLNLYAYCGNNPVMNIDPSGRLFFSLLIAGFVSAAISAGISIVSQGISQGWDNINWGKVASSALIGGLLGGTFALGGMFGVGAIAATKLSVGLALAGTALVSFGTGVGAYALEHGINHESIDPGAMFSYGAFTMFRGLVSFGVGAMMGAAGFYNKFDKNNALNIANKTKSINPVIRTQVARDVFKRNLFDLSIRTFFKSTLVTPWNLLNYLYD